MKRAKNKIIMFVVIGINVFILGFIISKTTNNLFYYGTNSENMIPNIRQYDVIGLDTLTKHLDYGDIVRAVYHTTEGDDTELFRIVGLPGDSVATKDNISIINGKVSNIRLIDNIEELLYDINFKFKMYEEVLPNNKTALIYSEITDAPRDNMIPQFVPDSCYFLLGDSRSLSIDSRFIGFVPLKDIKGKVVEVNGVRIDNK